MIHDSNSLTLIPHIKSLTLLIHENYQVKTNKELEKMWKNRGSVYKIACTRAVNQPRVLKEVIIECYAIVL